MKKLICVIAAAAICCSAAACSETKQTTDTSRSKSSSAYQSTKYAADDWMQDQAKGKNYGYDDGGSYYCMGKHNTCPNKTKNAYDLYCSSCDPDGDNIEG